MLLTWHDYRYYPYERELARREVATLLDEPGVHEVPAGIELSGAGDNGYATRLTYFANVITDHHSIETVQSRLEGTARLRKNRQATRYSVHGLHEYKGKFNPQVAKAILNIFGILPGQHVLDPFCGSGTTLVECAHIGALGYGVDVNPLAVFLANSKLRALVTPDHVLQDILFKLSAALQSVRRGTVTITNDARGVYLRSWFDLDTLQTIEMVRHVITDIAEWLSPIFLSIASNLLRDYSFQDPHDLRIRRRKSPLPDTPFCDVLLTACTQAIERITNAQAVLGTNLPLGKAVRLDVNGLVRDDLPALFDAAITSPPYAMALPYIDTQRLSLVWLELLSPECILKLEAALTGSREIRGSARKRTISAMTSNEARLPEPEAALCDRLRAALNERDGFRRQAVPPLLYRYFAAMRDSFEAVRSVMKPKAPFALIVGHNHTVLGGVRHNIDTPTHLANLAESAGWTVDELMPLQTYRRYGYHMSNAVQAETLIVLRNS